MVLLPGLHPLHAHGRVRHEVSDVGTCLLNVPKRRWSARCSTAWGWMPEAAEVYESPEVSGRITGRRGADGAARGHPVVGGAGDQAAGAVGNGIVRPGLSLSHHRHIRA